MDFHQPPAASASRTPTMEPPVELSPAQVAAQQWYAALREDNLEVAQKYWADNRAKLQINRITNGSAPLHIACRAGSARVVEFLVNECKANMISADKLGRHPFHVAVESQSVPTVEALLRHLASKPSWTSKIMRLPDDRGFTPLHLGIKSPPVLRLLLEHVEDVSAHGEFQGTPKAPSVLHCAVMWGFAEAVQGLLERNAGCNARDSAGRTPLSLAVADGHRDITALLVDKGAELNVADNDGMTELHWCYLMGHVGLGDWLVEQGSNPQATDQSGQSAAGCREVAVRELEEDGTLEEELALGGATLPTHAPEPVVLPHHVHIEHTGAARVGAAAAASPADIIGDIGLPPPRPPMRIPVESDSSSSDGEGEAAEAEAEVPPPVVPEPEPAPESEPVPELEPEPELESKGDDGAGESKGQQEDQDDSPRRRRRRRRQRPHGRAARGEGAYDGDAEQGDAEAEAERRLQREEQELLGYSDGSDDDDDDDDGNSAPATPAVAAPTDDEAVLRMIAADTMALAGQLEASLDLVSDDEDREAMEDLVHRSLAGDFGDDEDEDAGGAHVQQRVLHPSSLAALADVIGEEQLRQLESGDAIRDGLGTSAALGFAGVRSSSSSGGGGTGVGDDDFERVMAGDTEGMRVLQPRPWRS